MLYFLRHAPTALNDDASPHFRGWVDVPLDALGKRLAGASARWLAENTALTHIVTSDLIRAIQTGRIVAQPSDLPLVADRRLRPWNIGYLSGQKVTAKSRAQMNLFQTDLVDTPIPGGESYNEFLGRYGPALNELLARGQAADVLMVAHHRNALALDQLLRGGPVQVKGPPEPAGILALTPTDFREVFVPPDHHRGTGTGS